MKSFDEKAAETTAQDIRGAEKSRGKYRIEESGLVPADSIGTDEFPIYGDWLPVKPLDGGPEEELMDETYIECPGALGNWLSKNEIEEGDVINVRTVRKGTGGRWTYDVEKVEPTN